MYHLRNESLEEEKCRSREVRITATGEERSKVAAYDLRKRRHAQGSVRSTEIISSVEGKRGGSRSFGFIDEFL